MRRLVSIALALTVAACSSTPRPEPVVVAPVVPAVRETGQLIGLSEGDLTARFGRPSFQVREGVGLKWQWANSSCVLDAYLYPVAGSTGTHRVTHVDARRPNGTDFDSNACAVSLTR